MSSGSTTRVYQTHSLVRQRTSSGSSVRAEHQPFAMANPTPAPTKDTTHPDLATTSDLSNRRPQGEATYSSSDLAVDSSSQGHRKTTSMSSTPPLSRSPSFSGSSYDEDNNIFPPLERLTVFDFLENLALPQRLEKLQQSITTQTDRVRRQRQKLRSTGLSAKDKVIDEWRRRLPTPDERLEKYKKRMRDSVDRLGLRWRDSRTVTIREKVSFICGVLNIFISGYLIGARPDWFPSWYGLQLIYFMPIRFYTYRKKEYHYFLADLCYFVNMLLVLSIWVFPNSKRLFISTYCLAYGNNAVAIAMWRNMLVFHSLDKVTSLFIHIMPCATLHCIVHLIPQALQKTRYPAVHTIFHSSPSSPEHYTLLGMMVWASVPYAVWQLSYHFLISVRRREKIAAGRPTSFTWLRRSYAPTLIGKFVLSLPDSLQNPAFMLIQYSYALCTMVPCPLWFWSRWASSAFLMIVFIWSVYNGATYYIDIFGKRFQRELEALKQDVAKWHNSPEFGGEGFKSPPLSPSGEDLKGDILGSPELKGDLLASPQSPQKLSMGAAGGIGGLTPLGKGDLDHIPLLDERVLGKDASGVDVSGGGESNPRLRK